MGPRLSNPSSASSLWFTRAISAPSCRKNSCEKDDLQYGSNEESRHLAASDCEPVSRRIYVCRKHGYQKYGETDRCRSGNGRPEHANNPCKFGHSGERDQHLRPRECWRHHTNQISTTLAPVGCGRQQKHSGYSYAQAVLPCTEKLNSCPAQKTANEKSSGK